MGLNLEIKARLSGEDGLRELARRLAVLPTEELWQEDIFFSAPAGRLKLRYFGGSSGELILYERANAEGPKLSRYTIARTPDPIALKGILSAVLPIVGVVRKRRRVFLSGQTRIHLDIVDDLGCFLELEVMLRDGQPQAEGTVIAEQLLGSLGIERSQLVREAYIDLLLAQAHAANA